MRDEDYKNHLEDCSIYIIISTHSFEYGIETNVEGIFKDEVVAQNVVTKLDKDNEDDDKCYHLNKAYM